MEVHLTPDLQAKVDQWTADTGRPADELVQDAMAGYFETLAGVREIVDSRYTDLKRGRVQPIDGEEAFARFMAKTEVQRHRSA
jgi:hypothetical protein